MQINQGDGQERENLAGDFAQEQEIGADEVYVWLYNPQDGAVNNMVGAEIIDGALGVDDGFNLIDWEAPNMGNENFENPHIEEDFFEGLE